MHQHQVFSWIEDLWAVFLPPASHPPHTHQTWDKTGLAVWEVKPDVTSNLSHPVSLLLRASPKERSSSGKIRLLIRTKSDK